MKRLAWSVLSLLCGCSGAAPAALQDSPACLASPNASASASDDAGAVADAETADAGEDAVEASAAVDASEGGPNDALIACLESTCAGCCWYNGCHDDGLTNPLQCGRLGIVCRSCAIGATCAAGACSN